MQANGYDLIRFVLSDEGFFLFFNKGLLFIWTKHVLTFGMLFLFNNTEFVSISDLLTDFFLFACLFGFWVFWREQQNAICHLI